MKKIIKELLKNTFILYAMVGISNTIVGMGTSFMLLYFGIMDLIANTLGHAAGIINSYLLNKKFTFKSKNSHKKDLLRFLVAMLISYVLNIIALLIANRIFGLDKYISQVIASIVYTITGYIISKFWAFKQS